MSFCKQVGCLAIAIAFSVLTAFGSTPALAAEAVAVINIQKVLVESEAGKKAKDRMEAKVNELKAGLKNEEQALIALQKEIEKKASAWSEEKKVEKSREYKKKRLALSEKQEDANLEMKKLQDKYLTPIMKKLETIVRDVAKSKGYSVVIPRNSVLFYDKKIDITADTTKALNASM